MATLQPGEPARMYALATVARAGAARSGFVSGQVFLSYGGVHYGWGHTTPAGILIDSLSITPALDETPDTARWTINGAVVSEGDEVIITLGSKNATARLFAGFGLTVTQKYVGDKPANIQSDVAAVDYTWQLGFILVTAQYRAQTAAAIVRDLVTRFAGANGFTATGVVDQFAVLDEITFTNEDLPTAITRTMRRAGGYWYCDYRRDVHAFLTEEGNGAPEVLTPAHRSLAHVTRQIERTQALTRVYVEGRGSRLLSNVAIGDTIVPLDSVDMFAVAADVFLKAAFQGSEGGAQHLNFSGVVPSAGGSLVGPGIGPPGAPALAVVTGAGLLGTYHYAYTFTTAGGETLPSPLASIVVGTVIAAPAIAPTLQTLETGGALTPGAHKWAYTFTTPGGETEPSPATAATAAQFAVPAIAGLTYAEGMNGGVLTKGLQYQYAVTYQGTVSGETVAPYKRSYYVVDYGAGIPPNNQIALNIGGNNVADNIPPGCDWVNVYRSDGYAPTGVAGQCYYIGSCPVQQIVHTDGLTYRFASFTDATVPNGGQNKTMPLPSTNTGVGNSGTMRVLMATAAAPVSGRTLYRTAVGSAQLKLVAALDNAAAFYDDAIADGSLGANAPTSNTAGNELRSVTVSSVATGPAAVTARTLYRTVGSGAQLKLLTTLADNVTTTFTDTVVDAALGANVPTGDTSGLTQAAGQIAAGSTTIPVANVAVFSSTGGWAIIGNGEQVIRYTGTSGNAITGIPPTGTGAIVAAIVYNSTITTAPLLTGIPSSGPRSITRALTAGDELYVVVQCDDTSRQAALAADVGGPGIREEWVQDRRLSIAEARARGQATLQIRPLDAVTLSYTCRDLRTAIGKMVTANLPAPTNILGTYRIQSLVISNFRPRANQYPTYSVTASSGLFSFDDWLRRLRAEE